MVGGWWLVVGGWCGRSNEERRILFPQRVSVKAKKWYC